MGHDLNIRNAGKEFIATLKSEAALAGKTLRDYCLEILTLRKVDRVVLPDGTTAHYWPNADPRDAAGIERHAPVTVTACGADLSKPEVVQAVADVAAAAAKYIESSSPVVPASELPKPVTHRCPRCESKLVPWGTKVWRCVKCARHYTEGEL